LTNSGSKKVVLVLAMVASGLVVIDAANAALHKSGGLYSREGSGRQGKILHCNMKTIKQLK